LYDLGTGASLIAFSDPIRLKANAQRIQTPLSVFTCPTRRQTMVLPQGCPNAFYVDFSTIGARHCSTDYAANLGEIADTVSWTEPADYPSVNTFNWNSSPSINTSGVIMQHSQITIAQIPDGCSNTYLAGEKNMNPIII